MEEHRHYQRIPDSLAVHYRIITLGEVSKHFDHTSGDGMIENVSEDGMLIEIKEPIPVGSILEVEFKLKEVNAPLFLIGRVVRLDELKPGKKYEMGIHLTHYFNKDRDMLRQHLFML